MVQGRKVPRQQNCQVLSGKYTHNVFITEASNATDKTPGGGLPESIFGYEGWHCNQTYPDLVKIMK